MEAPQPLVGRYRFLRTFQGAPSGAIWLASDTVRDQTVVAATVSGPRSQGLQRIVGLQHPNLATVLEFVEKANAREVPATGPLRPGTGVAVAEYVAGQTLHERLETGAISPHQAVLWLVHIAAALAAIHGRGGVHGALSPRSIVVARTDRGAVPVLTNLRAIANGAYCSPERVRGGGPSAQDDAWALHATLYTAVTGAAPFGGRTREEVAHAILSESAYALADHGVDDPALQGILSRGLDRQARRRPRTVTDLGRELTAWLATQANVEPDGTSAAPPLDFSPRSIPPPAIDDEAVTTAAVHTLPVARVVRDVTGVTPPHGPAAMPRIRNAPEPGDQAVLSALTAKLHPPEIASLMDAMGRQSSPDSGEVEEDEDDETAIMSAPELEGLRQQVFHADRLKQAPAQAPVPREEPEDHTAKDASVPGGFLAPPPAVTAPIVNRPEPPAQVPYDRRAAPSSSGDWPARSLFDSMTEEVSIPVPPSPVDIMSSDAQPPAPPFPQVSASAPELRAPTGSVSQPAPSTPDAPLPPKRGRAGVWIALALFFVASLGVSAVLAVKYPDRLPIAIPGLRASPARPMSPASAVAPPSTVPATTSASAASSTQPPPAQSATEPDAAIPAASASAAPPDDPAACVKSFFPSDTFVRDVPLDYVCGASDPGTVAISLHRMLVKAGAGAVTGGMKIWSGLEWYELPIVVILRRSCCAGAAPLAWPAAAGTCPELGPLVEGIVTSRGDAGALKTAELAYEAGVRCYFTGGLPRPFRYNQLPAAPNRVAFDAFCRDNTK